ncbi:MAG: rhodanese-like domain-containing protein [Thermodesulfobacteriota bacterium]
MKYLLALLWFTVLSLAGCSNNEDTTTQTNAETAGPTATFRSIPVSEAKKILETRKDIVLLDVRTPEELRYGAIAGSSLVPFWAIMQNKLTLPKETPIMLVCAVGGRSYAAGQMLARYGYREVYNVSGGLSAWKEAGYPVNY